MRHAASTSLPAPLVSIGLPVYNGERFLAQALNSLLAQTFDNFEIVVSDNASTDRTLDICADFARIDPRVRIIRHERNIGAPRNWTFVAGEARGKYFKWASANDWCAPEFIASCVGALKSEPGAVLAYGHTCLIDEDTGAPSIYSGDFAISDARPSDRFRHLVRELALNNAQNGLIRVDALRRTGLDRPYPGGDLVLMAELALAGSFVLLPDVLLYRRMGGKTFSLLLRGTEVQAFFDPQSVLSGRHTTLRQHRDYIVGICSARVGFGEKLRAMGFAAQHVFWDLDDIWQDVRHTFSHSRHD